MYETEPKWILLSEVRSAEAVSAVRNSISSGHNILSTIHADKASAIPYRLYSLMETDLDVHQFLSTIYRYIQLGVHIKAFYSKEYGKFHRELDEVSEFYVDDDNVPKSRIIYQKLFGKPMMCKPSAHLIEYLENQNIEVQSIIRDLPDELPIRESNDSNIEEYHEQEIQEENPAVNDSGEKKEEVPSTEAVSAEQSTPVVEDTPAVEASVEAPAVETPAVETPVAETPAVVAPVVEATPPVVEATSPTPISVSVQPSVVSVQQSAPVIAGLTKLES